MSFFCPIRTGHASGVEVARVELFLTLLSPSREVDYLFRLDTGADITTVSEDVAATCGIPTGGTPISLSGVGGQTAGRLVDVRYRFPADAMSGTGGLEVQSTWAVISTRTDTALLSLADVHRHFSIGTDDAFMHFAER